MSEEQERRIRELESAIGTARDDLARIASERECRELDLWKASVSLACWKACPDGYEIRVRSQRLWAAFAEAVNAGIDAHLEAITERSKFDASTGKCLIHPDELHVFIRRLIEGSSSDAALLAADILVTLQDDVSSSDLDYPA